MAKERPDSHHRLRMGRKKSYTQRLPERKQAVGTGGMEGWRDGGWALGTGAAWPRMAYESGNLAPGLAVSGGSPPLSGPQASAPSSVK